MERRKLRTGKEMEIDGKERIGESEREGKRMRVMAVRELGMG